MNYLKNNCTDPKFWMVLYLIKDCKYAFEQLPVVEWVFSWFVLRRPARTCLLFQGRRDEVSDLRFPSAHDRMRLGEVTKVKGTCPLPELRKRCLKTTKTMHSDCWAHFLSPDLTIHLKPACDPWPSRAQSEHLANITSQFLTMMRCSWYSGSAEFCCGVIVGHS